jgi:lipopolysaccharide biosynthesis regulator YciM
MGAAELILLPLALNVAAYGLGWYLGRKDLRNRNRDSQ